MAWTGARGSLFIFQWTGDRELYGSGSGLSSPGSAHWSRKLGSGLGYTLQGILFQSVRRYISTFKNFRLIWSHPDHVSSHVIFQLWAASTMARFSSCTEQWSTLWNISPLHWLQVLRLSELASPFPSTAVCVWTVLSHCWLEELSILLPNYDISSEWPPIFSKTLFECSSCNGKWPRKCGLAKENMVKTISAGQGGVLLVMDIKVK